MHPKGNAVLRWTYARWVQILAHFDLLGPDGRPSFSKMATVFALWYALETPSDTVAIIALCAAFGPRVLVAAIRSWRGVTAAVRARVESFVRQERDAELGIDPA